MIRKLSLIIIMFMSMFLMSLPSYASSAFFFGFDFLAPVYPVYPYYPYPYDTPYYNQAYGDLEIQVTPGDVEIYVDGRFIGRANDFKRSAIILVPSGTHVVEFKYNGSSSSTNVKVAPNSKSVVQQNFSNSSKNPS